MIKDFTLDDFIKATEEISMMGIMVLVSGLDLAILTGQMANIVSIS